MGAEWWRVALLFVFTLLTLGVSSTTAQATGNLQQAGVIVGKIVAQSGDAYIAYDETTRAWEIGTNGIRRRMDYKAGAGYRLTSLMSKLTGREWLAPGGGTSSELHMVMDGREISGTSRDLVYKSYATQTHRDGSLELQVSLTQGQMTAHLHYAVFPGTSVLEQWAEIENTGTTPLRDLTVLDSISLALRPSADPLTLYWVQGLSPEIADKNQKQPVPTVRLRSLVLNEGVEQGIGSRNRSSEDSMGWFVLSAPNPRGGIFGGIKWSGNWQLRVARKDGQTTLRAGLEEFRHTIAPGEIFRAPRRFLGFYRGDLDEAANASHEFARRYLLRPRPANFPWTQYNTWFAYYTDLNEETLQREVDRAAELGLETFVLDAGWYEGSPPNADFSFGLGTWRENPEKFPSGLAAFSDYVHRKGLKFGLWVEPERVDLNFAGPGTEISLDWIAPGTDLTATPPPDTARAAQICLGHRDAREWMKRWLARLVRDYRLDWLKWDNNAWYSCDPPGQAGDGNLLHVQGLYEVLDYLREQFPDLIIENCASGGNRMDYGLMRRTDIAWLSDETDPSYRVRYHVTGASYPFPSEYLNSWLVESYFEHLAVAEKDPATLRAWLRSRMMGAFGISVSTLDWSKEFRTGVSAEIQHYKSYRGIIANGKHYKLLPQSDLDTDLEPPKEPEAAAFYDPVTYTGVIFLFRGTVPWTERRVLLKGLSPNTRYQIDSADGRISTRLTGRQMMTQTIRFQYAIDHPSVVLYLRPAPPTVSSHPLIPSHLP